VNAEVYGTKRRRETAERETKTVIEQVKNGEQNQQVAGRTAETAKPQNPYIIDGAGRQKIQKRWQNPRPKKRKENEKKKKKRNTYKRKSKVWYMAERR